MDRLGGQHAGAGVVDGRFFAVVDLIVSSVYGGVDWLGHVVNKPRGSSLSNDALSMHIGQWRRTVHVIDIAQLTVTSWSDSTDVELQMRDGTAIAIPSNCYGNGTALGAAFKSVGICVVVK